MQYLIKYRGKEIEEKCIQLIGNNFKILTISKKLTKENMNKVTDKVEALIKEGNEVIFYNCHIAIVEIILRGYVAKYYDNGEIKEKQITKL